MKRPGGSAPHGTWWYGRFGVVLVAALALTGCSQPDARYFTHETDVTRATRIWNDPWVAPTTTTAASGGDVLPDVRRDVASRTYQTAQAPGLAALDEIQAAQTVGWELTGANCVAGTPGRAVASLKRGGDLDRAATAWVLVGDERDPGPPSRAVTSQDDGTKLRTPGPGSSPVTVKIIVEVPHHLDREWPNPPAVLVEDTCLAGTLPGVAAQLGQAGGPLPDKHVPGKASKPTRRPAIPDSLLDARETANDDPVLADLGLVILPPERSTGRDIYRAAEGATQPQTATVTTLTDTVGQATENGWTLTYTGCWASGTTLAELHRDLSDGYSVALRLEQVPSPSDTDQTTFSSAAVVSTPTEGGPGPGELDEVTTPCWAQEPADPDALPAFSWTGTPWFGPTGLGAVQP